ncbi:transglutaminase family protein [Haloferula sp. A504]|uniref:transglutaminase family protein n=1 Tax=Haloferula sp. A504 TaxID=3373601 RepID=UPI0031BD2B66|nr:transglutaminase-like domain-containing protein [Verrucomicrobiaceae bacterium E54]
MPGPSPTADFATLLRLLDDETPEVRQSVATALGSFDGDVSELIGEIEGPLRADHLHLLSDLLRPARRARLRREWIIPGQGLACLHEDWDHSESMLRVISDFLHDGVTLRQPLVDALDLLAEESEPAFLRGGAVGLLQHLLAGGTLRCDSIDELQPAHLDLAAAASGHPSNAVGCGAVTLLVARRLGAAISGINLPATLLLVCEDAQGGTVHDPASHGREIDREDLLHRISRHPDEVRIRCGRPISPGELLLRVVEELALCYSALEQDEDADLFDQLVASFSTTV